MRRAFLRTVRLELRQLLGRRAAWLIWGGFCLAVLISCLSPWFRQSYLPATRAESLLLVALELLLPWFLTLDLLAVLAPVFAGEEERGLRDTANPCLLGRRGRDLAKLLAAEGYALLLCLGLSGTALLLCGACGEVGELDAAFTQMGDVSLSPAWTVGEQAVFAVFSLGAGSLLLALAILGISARAKDAITAAGTAAMALLFEFLFHRFSFPLLLREVNIWVFFRPYYFFVMELFPFPPVVCLLALGAIFSVITAALLPRSAPRWQRPRSSGRR